MPETLTYNKLFAGNVMPVVTEKIIIASGAGVLSRGAVVGVITASGKGNIVDSTRSDGSQKPYGILCDAVDATSADKAATIYMTGEFNSAALTFGGTDTAATHKAALRELGIFLKTNISA